LPERDLSRLFEPRSVAIVGATADPSKWGHWLTRRTLAGAHRRSVYLLSRSGDDVLGRPTYVSFEDLPETPELAVLAIPAGAFEATVEAALARGTRAFVAISAGFAETGEDGAARQAELVEKIRDADGFLVGPNCVGVVDTAAELEAAWIQAGTGGLPPGSIGLISQSGNVAFDVGIQARELGIGFSRFAALGNQADVTIAEVVASLAGHEPTRLIAVYAEDFKDGREFAAAAARASAAGKPVLVIAAGGGEAVQRASSSHTGSLASDDRVLEAMCRAAGAVLVRSPSEMMEAAQVLLRSVPVRGPRVAVVGDAGGHGVMATGLLDRAGFEVPATGTELRAGLEAELGPAAAIDNPVDSGAAGLDPFLNVESLRLVAESGEFDSALLVGNFGGWDGYDEKLAEREIEAGRTMARIAAEQQLGLVAHTLYPETVAAHALRDGGAAVFRNLETAVRALGNAAAAAKAEPAGVPELPAPAGAVRGDADYFVARELIASSGVRFAAARAVDSEAEALAAAAEIGYPVALKAVGLLHKSDAGGVALGIADADALRAEFGRMRESVSKDPLSVEGMVDARDGVEILLGCHRDPRFGPLLTVGIGGVFTELLEDVSLAFAPVDADGARAMLGRLRGAALLHGLRGRPGIDLEAVAAAAAALSQLAAAHPEIDQIEVNPLLATPTGATALDARVLLG
jgi:acyl-CoA synthetase (NDP forming)